MQHKRNFANITGAAKLVLGTLFYKGVRFERGENWSYKPQALHFHFSICFFYLPLFNSVTK
jgi:hypothetical protein